MRIVSSQEMIGIDKTAVEQLGVPSLVLMENAGLESARVIGEILKKKNHDKLVIVCGKGKNGGDGLVVARRLLSSGYKVRIFLMHSPSEYTGEAQSQLHILQKAKAKIFFIESVEVLREYFNSAPGPHYVVDAILGTGLARTVEGIYYDVIETINKNATQIYSLDIPSGVNGDNGKVAGSAVFANTTISYGYPKLGHFVYPGAARRGSLYNADLSFPREWQTMGDKYLLSHNNVAPLLQNRDRFGHKNSFGHCLLVGGSPGKLGAIEMASQSCLKVGTGLVTVASWEDSFPTLEAKLSSEIMNIRITKGKDTRGKDDFVIPKPGFSLFTSAVLGPGLGMREDGRALIEKLLMEWNGPLVLDADGLNIIGDFKMHDMLAKRPGETVLTPHPGEMARLLNKTKDEVMENPLDAVKVAVDLTGAVVLLKGATTILYSSDNVMWFNHYPNDGMATAGSGDVLAGMIGGLLGQKMKAIEAARLGVFVHSIAGKHAAEQCGHRSMTARDIINNIRLGFKELNDFHVGTTSSSCELIV